MPRKYTLCLTHQCNLRCAYCYIDKRRGRMSIEVADKIIASIFDTLPPDYDPSARRRKIAILQSGSNHGHPTLAPLELSNHR